MKSNRLPQMLGIFLLLLSCALGIYTQRNGRQNTIELPHARFDDATPLGGKGLRLMLQNIGYTVKRADAPLARMPSDARVWFLLDPDTEFSRKEADNLLTWIKGGGTLVWASASSFYNLFTDFSDSPPRKKLQAALHVSEVGESPLLKPTTEILPPLSALTWNAPAIYRSGVQKAGGSGDILEITGIHTELAATPFGAELAVIGYGKGRVIVTPDALLYTNYALAKDDNAVLVSNFVRVHAEPGDGAIYFDERSNLETLPGEVHPNLLYYLWKPPLRWALLQLLGAALLAWTLYGRRLGAPVPLPDTEPVTRASQFAYAMGSLFRKANRPRAASAIIGEEFRRALVRRLGMSITDSDRAIAARAAQLTGLPAEMIDRLLLRGKNPDDDEAAALHIAQEMEIVLRRLSL